MYLPSHVIDNIIFKCNSEIAIILNNEYVTKKLYNGYINFKCDEKILDIQEINDDNYIGYIMTTTKQSVSITIESGSSCCGLVESYIEKYYKTFIGRYLKSVSIGEVNPTIKHNDRANVLFLNIECHPVDYTLIKNLSIDDQVFSDKFEMLVSNENNDYHCRYYYQEVIIKWMNFMDKIII